jgi:hypothetical protein
MNECHPVWRHRMSVRDRQMLTAAYLPVVVFGAVLITAGLSRTRRHQPQAAPR